jgi:hypothetical protein
MLVGLQIAIWLKNESSESLLEAYGIVTKNNITIDTLNPKICPNCNEGNVSLEHVYNLTGP